MRSTPSRSTSAPPPSASGVYMPARPRPFVMPPPPPISAAWAARLFGFEPADVGDRQRRHRRAIRHHRQLERRQRIALLAQRRRHRGDAVLVLLGQADPEVDAERLGDGLAEERAERAAGDPAHQLADRPAEVDHVVAVAGARLPERLLGLQAGDHAVPVVELAGRRPRRAARGRRPSGRASSAPSPSPCRRGELRPVLGDRRLEVEHALRRRARARTARWRPSCSCARSRRCRAPRRRPSSGRPRRPTRRRPSSPSSVRHSDAPTSPRSSKLRTNSSTTGVNRSS